ncbi:dihydrofolate reductase family protein [Microbacterium sp. ET2]|uniref:dihydrofolate reductase family protein n=1 Tax=Microbacterium albipurpureum TaxID=3050384 RepID=UPI00259C7849|nr:dihydrofolate reductase family protein [Microbacterium sp. ET2 (Ac-2212)]WJL94960.1 dihydrofolate reductase family protein [Microbacterium sp. ET2 (Ac-2212)]
MGRLLYTTNVSLDGFIEDPDGGFDFLPAGDDVFGAHTELMQSVGTLVYGRRLYERMSVWETDPSFAARSAALALFSAAFVDTDKVVYSTSLTATPTARTRIERSFDPTVVREMKDAADRDLLIGGADLAGHALRARLVDEVQLYVAPVSVGGGKPGLPTGIRIDLDLLGERRFDNGVVLLRYRPRLA